MSLSEVSETKVTVHQIQVMCRSEQSKESGKQEHLRLLSAPKFILKAWSYVQNGNPYPYSEIMLKHPGNAAYLEMFKSLD